MSQSFTSLLTMIGQRINIAKQSLSMSPGFQTEESQTLVAFSGPPDVQPHADYLFWQTMYTSKSKEQ